MSTILLYLMVALPDGGGPAAIPNSVFDRPATNSVFDAPPRNSVFDARPQDPRREVIHVSPAPPVYYVPAPVFPPTMPYCPT